MDEGGGVPSTHSSGQRLGPHCLLHINQWLVFAGRGGVEQAVHLRHNFLLLLRIAEGRQLLLLHLVIGHVLPFFLHAGRLILLLLLNMRRDLLQNLRERVFKKVLGVFVFSKGLGVPPVPKQVPGNRICASVAKVVESKEAKPELVEPLHLFG